MDLNLSSDSLHIDSPFFLQGNHRADGSAHKASRCLTLNPFPKARVESLGLPLCSEFPRIPGSKASLVWPRAPPGTPCQPASFSFQGTVLAGYSIQPQPLRRQGCWPPYTDEKLRLRLNMAPQLVSSTFGTQFKVCLNVSSV